MIALAIGLGQGCTQGDTDEHDTDTRTRSRLALGAAPPVCALEGPRPVSQGAGERADRQEGTGILGPTATPGLARAIPEPRVAAPPSQRAALFFAGYRAAGGPPEHEGHVVERVIPCEAGWQLDPPGYLLGLAQFDPGTWAVARCSPDADYRDPWEQGCAVENWLNSGIDPGSTAGGPTCWWR